jgi:hypothetical protein
MRVDSIFIQQGGPSKEHSYTRTLPYLPQV